MTKKDYLYLGLIALTALVFFLQGYFAGIRAMKRNLLAPNARKIDQTPCARN